MFQLPEVQRNDIFLSKIDKKFHLLRLKILNSFEDISLKLLKTINKVQRY